MREKSNRPGTDEQHVRPIRQAEGERIIANQLDAITTGYRHLREVSIAAGPLGTLQRAMTFYVSTSKYIGMNLPRNFLLTYLIFIKDEYCRLVSNLTTSHFSQCLVL